MDRFMMLSPSGNTSPYMKKLHLLVPCLSALVLSTPLASAQELKKADSLSPEDLGIKKYTFEVEAPEGCVIVFREEEYRDDQQVGIRELITHSSKQKHIETVLFFDWTKLGGDWTKRQFTLRTSSGDRNLAAGSLQFHEWRLDPPSLKFVINHAEAPTPFATTFLLSMTVERYETVKKRIPNLPPQRKDSGWTYADSKNLRGKSRD